MFQVWLITGLILIFAEVLLPGLVSMFIGLGALTVAGFLNYQIITSVPEQFITWFVSSTIYIFSLRLLIIKFYPTDTVKQELDEDKLVIGKMVKVSETIKVGETGRIFFGDTTWQAVSTSAVTLFSGEKVKVIKRDNITWHVEKLTKEEL